MRVVGIDPGLNLTGYGCVDRNGRGATLVEGGVIRLQRGDSMARRLCTLHQELGTILDELRPDLVVVEQLFAHYRHARTSIMMGHARGVTLLAAASRDIALDEMTPAEVKKAVTGNGQASKHQVQCAVRAEFRLAELPRPADVADAIAIAFGALERRR